MYRKVFLLVWPILGLWIWSVYGYANCSKPFGLSFPDKTTTSIDVRWSDGNINPLGWEIEITERGKAPSGIPDYVNIPARSFRIEMLNPSSAYDLYIRARCSSSSVSDWNGPFLFTTVFSNPTACKIFVPVKDNGTEIFQIDVDQPGRLGVDVFVKSVELLMEHTWPADMQIVLESPAGKSVILTNHYGTITDNFGDVNDVACKSNTIFDGDACIPIRQGRPPFAGIYKPEESFTIFDDNSPAKGVWSLRTFDRAVQDIGIIRYLKINFSEERCITPANFSVAEIDFNSVELTWSSFSFCNAARISIGAPGQPVDSMTQYFINCQNNKFTITGLAPNTEYQVLVHAICGTGISAGSCPVIFKTACEAATVSEGFDDLENCREGCAFACNIRGVWQNVTDDGIQDWIVWKGRTDTENTGPDGDISGTGKYVYIENNPDLCGEKNEVILESDCMDILGNPSGCDMSFYYHMFGVNTESLMLEVNTEGNDRWELLFEKRGDQGNRWIQQTLSLGEWGGKTGKFRFRAVSGTGNFGDIALDQIEFYKSKLRNSLVRYYRDQDGDGYGTDTEFKDLCTLNIPDGYSLIAGDCDDSNPLIHPGAIEIPCNAVDENCNGMEDDSPLFNPVTVSATVLPESCNGLKDGIINLVIAGGTPPYSVKWNNGKEGIFVDGLSHGFYFAEIRDFGGCVFRTQFFEVPVQTVINISVLNLVRPSCDGKSDGAIHINHSGGVGPIDYKWSNGAVTKDLINIPAGVYTLTLTDSNGCVRESEQISLVALPSFTAGVASMKTPRCHGSNDGSISIQVQGGKSPFQVEWNNGQLGFIISMITAGPYSCTVTDADGCRNVVNTILAQPPELKNEIISIEQVRCFGERNGAVKTITSGGTPPYTFFWNNFLFTESIFDVPAGNYSLMISDRNGCELEKTGIRVTQPQKLMAELQDVVPSVCPLGKNGSIEVGVSGGILEYNYAWKGTESQTNRAVNLSTGLYGVTVVDRNGCKSSITNIFVPFVNVPVLSELTLIKDNKCYLEKGARIEAQLKNGTAPYDYNWSSGAQYIKTSTRDTILDLPAGNYRLTVTDALGCFGESQTLTIPEKPVYEYSVTHIQNNVCKDDSTGEIRIEISGGMPPFTVNWSGDAEGVFIRDLPNGVYYGTIKDREDCMLTIQPIQIYSESNIYVYPDIQHATGGMNNGSICLTLSGALFPVNVSWSTGLSTNQYCLSGLPAGVYSVTVTDNAGCVEALMFEIQNISSLSENEYKNPVLLFPNPASETLYLINAEDMEGLQLYTSDGQIQEVKIKDNSMDISGLPSGLYFIRFKGNYRNQILKFIKI
jgi:subtilisin-like proprotein convertase family protein